MLLLWIAVIINNTIKKSIQKDSVRNSYESLKFGEKIDFLQPTFPQAMSILIGNVYFSKWWHEKNVVILNNSLICVL